MRWLIIGSSVVLLLLLSAMALLDINSPLRALSAVYQGYFSTRSDEVTALSFTGDLFLGRDVETKMRRWGSSYPFVGDPVEEGEQRVVNFEAAAPDEHEKTPDYTFQFSVDQAFLPILHSNGVRYASLANNHSFDHGRTGARETAAALADSNVTPFGATAPVSVIAELEGKKRVGLSGFNDVSGTVSVENVIQAMHSIATTTDLQIAYVHWGEEYKKRHNERQEALAQIFIAAGYDAVIGHHPHVIQDIGWYEGVPVFYSLGNYVFDQYFNTDVQNGLRVTLRFVDDTAVYELTPVTSEATYIQPQPMAAPAATALLNDVAERSTPTIASAVSQGRITQ